MPLENLRDSLHRRLDEALRPLTRALGRMGATANAVTCTALLLAALAAALVVLERPITAGLVWLVSGVLDLLDGAMARLHRQASEFGAFLDSTLDRVSEGLLLAAVTYRFAAEGAPGFAALTVFALLGSILVSYTRARAEALGASCKAGIAARGERVVLLAAGLLFGLLEPVIVVLAALSWVTVAQRIARTWRELSG